ncbi:MAG: transketolase, partial [Actinomycetota bacterium]|nr:transketolase [Actinomycetota bacterium]
QQALGYTADVLDLAPLEDRWRSFGWDVREVDGHDIPAMISSVASFAAEEGRPHVLIARTTFGKGVSFMQSDIRWHYLPMSEDQYRQALEEVTSGP